MRSNALSRLGIAVFVGTALLSSGSLLAGQWPDKPVRVIVPFAPGGGTDIQARLLTINFHEKTGQTFIVDNRAGAGGLIGGELTAHADPDGYTLLFSTATLAVNTTLFGKSMRFSAVKDLAPVSWVSSAPLVLVTHPNVPAKTVPELIALAKKRPNFMNGAVNTPGSTSHLSGEMFKQLAKISFVIVPFKGGGPAVGSVVAGETDFLFATAPSSAPFIHNHRLKALAVTTAKRASAFPDLPTMSEFIPGFVTDNWYAMFFPKGTPQDIVAKMNGLVKDALGSPKVKEFYAHEGLDPIGSPPEALTKLMKSEIVKYAKVIKRGNIKVR